ncbi:MAG TPA: HD domain-containing protein [Sphingobium sp.]|uniref:HD domain-containing protein n=1 Tax=Sphingobium sp. TaxID=1912891 RepID=UPI002ED069B7
MSDLVERAMVFAANAHGGIGQVRKYTGEPYINHPIEVMELVKTAAHFSDDMLAAALLHDTVEDTPVTQEDIERVFGPSVASLVHELTDQCHVGNRATRKSAEAARPATISPEAQTVKLADLISNSRSILEHDPGFARVYIQEKARVLEVMTAGDASLYRQARMMIASSTKTAPTPT